jgi:multidrug efflux system outer membrane protein
MRTGVSLGLAAALLAGCAGPRPAAPPQATVTAPPAWRDTVAGVGEVDATWWNSFGDPALTAVVEHALAANTDIALAAERVAEARAQFHAAEATRTPTLVLGVGGGEQRSLNAFGRPQVQTAGQGQFSAAYDLDLFGRLAAGRAAARASLLSSQASRDTVRLAVASSAASGYLTLRALDARLEALNQTLASRADALHLARRRAEAGYSPRLELEQAQAEYEAAAQLIPVTELAIRRQEDALSLLVGDAPGAFARGRALGVITVPAAPVLLPAQVLRRRPDIAQAEQQVAAADHSLDAARAAFMPSVQLTGTDGYVVSDLLSDPVHLFSIGGSALAPIFEGGRLRAQADAAAARRDQAAFAYRKTALTAFREVEDALAAARRTDEQVAALERQRQAAANALALASNRYRAGYSPYLEQLDAQRVLLAVDLALVQARGDRLTASVALYQALGGGWSGAPTD